MTLSTLPIEMITFIIRILPSSAATCLALTSHQFYDLVLKAKGKKNLKQLSMPNENIPTCTARLSKHWMPKGYKLCVGCEDVFVRAADRRHRWCWQSQN